MASAQPPPPPPAPGRQGPPPRPPVPGGQPPAGGNRPPAQASGHQFMPPMRQQVNSTRVVDITPQALPNAATCRRNLTSHSVFTIKKAVPSNPREKATWARAEVVEEKLARSEIAKQIKRLNERRGESVAEKKSSLQPFQQGQISNLLDDLATRESNRTPAEH
ncbi:hypothetical protein G7Y89_g14422 [Cudoniella acicularis]|uniref:Uncharacterized protein n=1 Tax=Cudoniella acicularis TaxID=354080 RepID=A0A8H4R304_9HELO|nr:hypothetical protein G7Y89_g14422 [Cudoniella acicularis]